METYDEHISLVKIGRALEPEHVMQNVVQETSTPRATM
jgi:hypothetical protein